MNKTIILRISEKDYNYIKEASKKIGLNISAFVRMYALENAKKINKEEK